MPKKFSVTIEFVDIENKLDNRTINRYYDSVTKLMSCQPTKVQVNFLGETKAEEV